MSGFQTLAEVELAHIAVVLRATGNNKTKSAEVLGVDRRTLYRKIRENKTLLAEFLTPARPVTKEQIEARIAALQEQLAKSAG